MLDILLTEPVTLRFMCSLAPPATSGFTSGYMRLRRDILNNALHIVACLNTLIHIVYRHIIIIILTFCSSDIILELFYKRL